MREGYKKCNCCLEPLPESEFANGGTHVDKAGTIKHYKRKTCKGCYSGKQRHAGSKGKREHFNRLLSWAAPLLLTTVIGIYQFDSVSGRNRTCTYSSIYGFHSVTIDALSMCPLTWEFEV